MLVPSAHLDTPTHHLILFRSLQRLADIAACLKTQNSLLTNRWKPTDSTLRTLSTEMGIDYPESSDSGDEVLLSL
jgi:hypothetical protein